MEITDICAILSLPLSVLLLLKVIILNNRVRELQSELDKRYDGSTRSISDNSVPTPLQDHNLEIAPDLERRIRLLLAEEKKIQAIKVIKDARNLTLKDAKTYIDAMQRGSKRKL